MPSSRGKIYQAEEQKCPKTLRERMNLTFARSSPKTWMAGVSGKRLVGEESREESNCLGALE